MLSPNPAALEFLLSRRSRPAKTLQAPAPSKEELTQLLTAAARTPDHGKLEPWRFIVIEQPAMARLAETVTARGEDMGMDPEKIAKGRAQFDTGILAIAVIEVQKPSDKIPAIEQTYSAGAVCLALLNAALAAGWGANWLSGWPSHDPVWRQTALGLAENEHIAGLVHIATEGATPPERPRPNLEEVVTWVST